MPQHAGQQPHDSIDKYHRRNRAIGQHIVADGNLYIDQMFDDAMIDSFVMSTNDDQMDSRDENSRATF